MREKVLIIGAGPGGLSCATYLQRLGISSIAVYETLGGKQNFYKTIYGLYPEDQVSTESFLNSQKESLNRCIFGNRYHATVSIVQSSVKSLLKNENGDFKVIFNDDQFLDSPIVVVATGTDVFISENVKQVQNDYYTFKDYPFTNFKATDNILVLGAGYTSAELVSNISEKVSQIQIVDISTQNYSMLSPVRKKLLKKMKNIRLIIDKNYELKSGYVIYHENEQKLSFSFSKVLLCTGEKPNVEFLPKELLNSTSGKVEIIGNPDNHEVNMSQKWLGLYAIGDVKNDKLTSYIDFAIADGMRTAQSINLYIKGTNGDAEK